MEEEEEEDENDSDDVDDLEWEEIDDSWYDRDTEYC